MKEKMEFIAGQDRFIFQKTLSESLGAFQASIPRVDMQCAGWLELGGVNQSNQWRWRRNAEARPILLKYTHLPTNWSRSTLFAVVKVVHVSNSFSKGLGKLPVMPHFLPLTARNGGIGSEFW